MSRHVRNVAVAMLALISIYTFLSTVSIPALPSVFTEHQAASKLGQQVDNEHNSDTRQYGFAYHPNVINKLSPLLTLRQQLAFQFPYEPRKPFPKNIWQTWKVDIEDAAFPPNYKRYLTTWSEKNPGYNHQVLADQSCHKLIVELYQTVPDVVAAYQNLPKSILKADFFRYLILFARGGVYSDIDTTALKPVQEWASLGENIDDKPNSAGIVVAIEADPDRPDWAEWYARRIQFCQWTIQLKKGHPLLRDLIANITDITLTRKAKGQLSTVLGKDEGGDIMNWTGPGIWTDSVFSYLNNVMQPQENFRAKTPREIVNWETFTGLRAPKLVEDVMVLPITSFSPDVGQMGSQSSTHALAYAKHMFSGSWKPEDERMR